MTDDTRALPLSRRALLKGAASLAALAVAMPGGAAPARAETAAARRSTLAAFDPYAQAQARGPSSQPTPATGATPSVPGEPYLRPMAPGWSVISLITAGNTARSGYRMAGIPDGLGAFSNGDGTLTVLMNHELTAGKSVTRGHGGRGAFVSRWIIDIASLEVVDGRDMVDRPANWHLWSGRAWTTAERVLASAPREPAAAAKVAVPSAPQPAKMRAKIAGTPAAVRAGAAPPPAPVFGVGDVDIDRLCSADLAPVSAFWDAQTGRGYNGRILLNGEESETRRSRAFAWIDATRAVHELPAFETGRFGDHANATPEWENLLANPRSGVNTVVMANSDGGPSQIYCYIGRKQRSGSPIEKAGLTGGKLYSLKVAGVGQEKRDSNIGISKAQLGKGSSAPVSLVPHGKGTAFLRPEDGAWDPRDPDIYYFATTDRNNLAASHSVAEGADATQEARTRLWAVIFDDVRDLDTSGEPTARIQMLLDGTEGGDMFDNITVDRNGIIYLCEDSGDARHNEKIWAYDTETGNLTPIFKFDPALFGDVVDKVYTPPVAPFIDDKEISGILDVTALFETAPWFRDGSTVLLASVQPHFGYDGGQEIGRYIYEGGQLVLLVKAPV